MRLPNKCLRNCLSRCPCIEYYYEGKRAANSNFWDKCSLYERLASFIRINVPGKGHSPTRATLGRSEPNFHTFPYKTCRTFHMRTKKKLARLGRWPYYLGGSPSQLGQRFSIFHILARPAGQTRSREDNQRMRKCCWLRKSGQHFFFSLL